MLKILIKVINKITTAIASELIKRSRIEQGYRESAILQRKDYILSLRFRTLISRKIRKLILLYDFKTEESANTCCTLMFVIAILCILISNILSIIQLYIYVFFNILFNFFIFSIFSSSSRDRCYTYRFFLPLHSFYNKKRSTRSLIRCEE